jgi:hypothetical protein
MSARDAAEGQAAQRQIQQQQQSAQQLAAQRDAQLRDAEQRQRQAASPPDAKSTLEAQIHDVQKQREKLEIELDRVHADQKQLPPPNQVRYTRYHTAWGNRRDGYIKSIQTSPNAEALANREKELRKQVEGLKDKERLLRVELK